MGVLLVSFRRTLIAKFLARVLLGSNGCVQVVQWMFYDCLDGWLSSAYKFAVIQCVAYHCLTFDWFLSKSVLDVYAHFY